MAEFKIGNLRYTWKGYWANGTFYNRDAVVAYNGKTYVCLVPHTSGNFYADAEFVDPQLGPTPYWLLMLDGTIWEGEWAPSTSYTLDALVHYGSTVYKCITNHTSGPTINFANWEVYLSVDSTWSGDYTPNTFYKTGDVVKYNGIVYKCITQHTSAPAVTIDSSKWQIVNVGIEYKGEWTVGVAYRLNDVIKFNANLWIATVDHTSTNTFTESTWDLWIPGLEYESAWGNTALYQIGDVVTYGGYAYINNITNNTNIRPTEGILGEWTLLATGYQYAAFWESIHFYEIGSIVYHGGNTFVAIADHTNQDPSVTNISKNYVAAGSSGTVVKLNNTTGLAIGMIVSGAGFNKGQIVSNIIDLTTIVVSQPPYSSIIDGTPLSFSSVNAEYWEIISTGVRWKNRWTTSIDYVVGDIAVWKNTTYYCIKNHSSTNINRPDLDISNQQWISYLNHDRFNVLNQPGDIVVSDNGTNVALPIGSEGFLLKAVAGTPTWANVFQTPAVYYVAPSGSDLITSGDTWDNPFQSIQFACTQIAQGRLNPTFRAQLIVNKQAIILDAQQWVVDQIASSTAPFSSGNVISSEKTGRDASFLLDALAYDLSRGGNSQTIAFTYSFFDKEFTNQFISSEVAALMPQFVATISHVVDTLVDTLSIGGQLLTDIQSLETIITTALSTSNTSSIPTQNQGLTATLMVKTGVYEETLPIVVPANTALNGDELRSSVVKPKIVVDTIATRTRVVGNLITVSSVAGLSNNTPVQFVSINPISGINTVFGGLESGRTYYVIGSSITGTTFSVSETINGTAKVLSNFVSRMRVVGGDALSDMFYMQNGTGLRNMTLTGLLGTLSELNAYNTRRPTGGAYVSLDPGQGTNDTSAWIYRKSPYIQNVTTFGVGATGLKIDGTLHDGGNKSIVCNDFTQIISDGIGIWCTGPDSLCEAVSVFSYYAYAGYFADAGGRIRATNGNSSYGTFGVIAEGFNNNEAPISGTVDNRYYEATATPVNSLGASADILKLQYSHAGENYFPETTNMLQYSNLFTNWTSDSNITLIQSVISPTGQSNAWIATGNTSGTDSSYFYQNITVAASGSSYTALSGDSQTGGGIGATFDVVVTSTQYIVSVNSGGSGYVTTNQITINGSRLGGLDIVNDLVITVASLVTGTSISTINISGTVPAGSIQPYTCSIYCKKGTSTLFDIVGIFSGYQSVTSGISFNLNTQQITSISATGGMTPTLSTAVPVSGAPGWYRISFVFYDITALNTNLQIRVYPRSSLGASGYTLVYGSQLEIGNNLGFYLETTTERFTSHANFTVVGAGSGAYLVGDELRSESVYQTRILEVNGNTGGTGHLLSSNNAQVGDSSSITLAGSDTAGEKEYLGMRVFINSGTGAGQYGVVSTFDPALKIAKILRESFTPVTIISTDSATDSFVLAAGEDVNTLYIDQPIQFVPTNYVIDVTNISQANINVTATIGGSTNTITVESTARLAVNMPVTFSGETFGGVTSNFTYYVLQIIDVFTIQVSTTVGGSAVLLNTTTATMTLNYPSGTSYFTGDTTNMDINLPIYFTGDVFSTVIPGQTYYVNEIFNSTTFTVSSNLINVTATATNAVTRYVSVGDTASLRSLNPIVFTGTTFGGILPNVKYYINHIVDATRITISSAVVNNNVIISLATSNLFSAFSTTGFIIGNPIVFTGTTFGGIVSDRIYYIHYVANTTFFSISNTSTLLSITATQSEVGTNDITVDDTTNLMPLNPIVFAGTTFGGINAGTEYYISRIISATKLRVSPSIISVEVSATEELSNLITVTSTTGFVANHPIIFGGISIGGIESGRVYFISAVNNATSFTISTSQGGGQVTLTTSSGSMTARTTSASVILSSTSGTMTATSRFTGTAITLTAGTGACSVRTTAAASTLTTATGTLEGTSTVVKESFVAGTGSMNGTFSVPLIGGVSSLGSYFVTSITPGASNTFKVSELVGGSTFALTNSSGSMRMGELGWDHINPGSPLAASFDSTTVYSVEPTITYSKPSFTTSINSNIIAQAPGTEYISIGYGNDKFVAVPSGGLSLSVSTDGDTWTQQQLPVTGSWKSIAYGNGYWVIIAGGTASTTVLYSNSDLVTWKSSTLPSSRFWQKVVYGNGKFVAISNDGSGAGSPSAYSSNFGATWAGSTGLTNAAWSGLAYGAGTFVTVGLSTSGPSTARIAYSIDGIAWTDAALPVAGVLWSSITYGNGRFVAVSPDVSPSVNKTIYSFDGITWYESRYAIAGNHISYGNGVFLVTPNTGSAGYLSEDGVVWYTKIIPAATGPTVFGFDTDSKGLFVGVSGQSAVSIIRAGSQTKARAQLYQDKIVLVNEWDPGSNYLLSPTVTISDSNATKFAVVQPALGNGVLGNPTFYNRGSGYNTTSTLIYISGGGYAENFQVGLEIIFEGLTRLPSPGDNLVIAGNSIVYKVTQAEALDGTVAPAVRGLIGISPSMTTALAPTHGTSLIIRTKYSQVRLTNHDYLNIGYGNFEESNYPRLPLETVLSPQNEAVESNYGRVFYSSTDQDGNFRVGKLFAVEQATGIVTLSASQFGLEGLSELRLGGIAIGGNSVVITQFSTESTFVANSNNIISTQKAIKAYLTARLSQGGANTFTGNLIAGTVSIGNPDQIRSTLSEEAGGQVRMPNKVNVNGFEDGGWDGDGMAMAFYMQSISRG